LEGGSQFPLQRDLTFVWDVRGDAGDKLQIIHSLLVRIIKSNSARILFREFPGLKRRLWSGEMWEGAYFAQTVGDRLSR